MWLFFPQPKVALIKDPLYYVIIYIITNNILFEIGNKSIYKTFCRSKMNDLTLGKRVSSVVIFSQVQG